MSKEKTVFPFVLITFSIFLLFFLSIRIYLVYSGNVPGSFSFSEVLAGFLEDVFLASALSLSTLLTLSLSKALYLLLVFPLNLIVVITCYANLQYVNFFGENLALFDLEYIRNLGSVWKFSLNHIWIRRGEPFFLILPLLAILAELVVLLKTKIRKYPAAKFLILSSALLGLSLATFWGGEALANKENKLGFHQNNYFVEMIKGIPRLRNFIKARQDIKKLKIIAKEQETSPGHQEALNHNHEELSLGKLYLKERPVPLPEDYVWYSENYPFIKIPRRDAVRMGLLSGGEEADRTAFRTPTKLVRNVVFIFMESFRSKEIDLFGSPYSLTRSPTLSPAFQGGDEKRGSGLTPNKPRPSSRGVEGLTPNFDALASKGILFNNFYGHSDLTAGAEFSTICSFYEVFKGIDAMRGHPQDALFSLPEILSLLGYTNYWINSWSADFDNSRNFFSLHGNFQFVDKYAFPLNAAKAGGHYDDEEIMKMAVETMDKARRPFFAMILTATNHMPYRVPEKKFELGLGDGLFSRYLDTFHYSDYALGRFFELVRNKDYFKNTLFFVFADTGDNRSIKAMKSLPEYFENIYHIPLLIYDPSEETGRVVKEIGGQVDIAPTVLDLLGIQIATPFVGQSLLQKRMTPFYLSYHGRDNPSVFFSSESLLLRYNLENEQCEAFDRKNGERVDLSPSERQKIISTIREMVTLGDWSFFNDKIWDPKINQFYKNLYKKGS